MYVLENEVGKYCGMWGSEKILALIWLYALIFKNSNQIKYF